jgi:hypothetical protein
MFNFVPTARKSPILFFLPTFDSYGIVANELKLFCSVRSNMLVEKKIKDNFCAVGAKHIPYGLTSKYRYSSPLRIECEFGCRCWA